MHERNLSAISRKESIQPTQARKLAPLRQPQDLYKSENDHLTNCQSGYGRSLTACRPLDFPVVIPFRYWRGS